MALLLPGQPICQAEGFIKGHGTNLAGSTITSTYCGHAKQINKLITVNPVFAFQYAPEIGDVLIGRVTQIFNKKWKIDANARVDTTLSLSAINLPGVMQRRKLEADEMNMRTFFDVDDLLVCEVQKVAKSGAAALHTRNEKYRRLTNGLLIAIPQFLLVPLKTKFLCKDGIEAIVGSNGYIWISVLAEEPEGYRKAAALRIRIQELALQQSRIDMAQIMDAF
ncbi:exosome complex component RRP4 [Pancytospora philotis]|nr:exosome complex component RRP4 [Pancytospora philotis]